MFQLRNRLKRKSPQFLKKFRRELEKRSHNYAFSQ